MLNIHIAILWLYLPLSYNPLLARLGCSPNQVVITLFTSYKNKVYIYKDVFMYR